MTETTAPTLSGVVPPLLTPLNEDRTVDVAALERLTSHLLDSGVDGIFALGSSSETAYFDDATRAQVLEVIMGTVAGQVPVLVGVIDMQTARVQQHIRAASIHEPAGYVATAPFYAMTGPEEIARHFRALAEQATAPIWAYDIPVNVHVKLAPSLLVDLATEGSLAGVKDSSGDDVSFRRLAMMNKAAGEPLSLLTGHEVVVDGAYLAGGHGVVPGLGNVDPAGYVRLHRAAVAGDWATVRAEQDRLAALFEIVFAPVGKVGPAAGIGAFKTALQALGIIPTNQVSEPMTRLEGQTVERIRAIVQEAGLLR